MTVTANQRYCSQIQVVAEAFAEAFAKVAADITAEVLVEVTTEVLVVLLNRGVGNLVHHYIVVQAGSGFNVDTGAAPCSTVAER